MEPRNPSAHTSRQPATRQGGRKRNPGHDAAILDATLRLLARDGYARMSLQAVADEAGVSKATIHLRWSTKANLATAALEHQRLVDLAAPTGETRKDLLDQIRWHESAAERFSAMGLVGACLAEERTTPELMRLLRERAARPRLQNLVAVLDAARDRGEIDSDADVQAAARLLFGTFYAAYLPGEAAEDLAERAVDLVLRSLGYKPPTN